MEILFVSHKFPPSIGGMEKQSFELINGIKKFARVHSIVYEEIGSRLHFFLSLKRKILEVCQINPGISVIHFNDGLMAAFCLRHKAYNHLKRTVTLHGLDVVFPNFIYQRFIFPEFNRFDLIITVSKATAEACIQRHLSPAKIVVINNGVDTEIANAEIRSDFSSFFKEKFGFNLEQKKVLVAMGRPVKRKGFSWFIQNVVPLLKGDFVLLLIGPYRKKNKFSHTLLFCIPPFLRRQIELLAGFPTDESNIRNILTTNANISNKVIHLGKLPFEEIIQILLAAHAFIMPNIPIEGDMEGFGLVCLEASLCGTLVIASETGGITDAIRNGKNGMLLPAQHAEKWIFVLNTLIENPAKFAPLAKAGKLYSLENFSWTKMAHDYWIHFLALTEKI